MFCIIWFLSCLSLVLLKSILLFANSKLFLYTYYIYIQIYVYTFICIWRYVRISIQLISVCHFPQHWQWSEFSSDTRQSSLNSSFPNPGSFSQPLFHRLTPPTPPTSQRLPWHDSPGITALHTHIKLLKPQCILRQSTVSLNSPTTKTNKQTNPDFKYMYIIPYVYECLACMYVQAPWQAWYPQKPEKSIRSSGTGVTESWQTVKPKCDHQTPSRLVFRLLNVLYYPFKIHLKPTWLG